MSFPFKSVIFDWAWTLVDLGSEDDRAAFQALTAALQSKGFIVKNPEDTYAASLNRESPVWKRIFPWSWTTCCCNVDGS
ncbi:MAG: hypothetical protein ACE5ER_08375 [Nitrospinaceae bacterium]